MPVFRLYQYLVNVIYVVLWPPGCQTVVWLAEIKRRKGCKCITDKLEKADCLLRTEKNKVNLQTGCPVLIQRYCIKLLLCCRIPEALPARAELGRAGQKCHLRGHVHPKPAHSNMSPQQNSRNQEHTSNLLFTNGCNLG